MLKAACKHMTFYDLTDLGYHTEGGNCEEKDADIVQPHLHPSHGLLYC